MFNFFGAFLNGIGWIFNATGWFLGAGWNVWSSLFSAIPYGDPYIAIIAALMLCYVTVKTIHPCDRTC